MAVAPILPRAQRHEMPEEAERRWSIFPPTQGGERCTGGAGVDSGRTIALGIRRSGTAPMDIKTKVPAI